MEKSDQVLMLSVGPTQLISAIYEEIGFRETINQLFDWDRVRAETPPGVRLEALVINMLMDHQPLYQIRTLFSDKDLEKLFGPGVTLQQFNDSAFGRTLDQLHAKSGASIPRWRYPPARSWDCRSPVFTAIRPPTPCKAAMTPHWMREMRINWKSPTATVSSTGQI